MTAKAGNQDDPVTLMERLLALEYTLVEAYQAAIEHIADRQYRAALERFRADHQRQTQELEALIGRLGGKPPTGPGSGEMLVQSRKPISELVGDEAIFLAVKTKEEDADAAYERAISIAPPEADDVLTRGRDALRHHQNWSAAILGELSASASYQGIDLPPR
jgi:rubrerythrin